MSRPRDRLLVAPPRRQSRPDARLGQSGPQRPRAERERLAAVSQFDSRTAVVRLFGRRRPPTIFGAVIAGIVDAVNGVQLGRPRTNVRQEAIKTALALPAFAHAYPPPAIPWVFRHLRVVAPIPHLAPNDVLAPRLPCPVARRPADASGHEGFVDRHPVKSRRERGRLDLQPQSPLHERQPLAPVLDEPRVAPVDVLFALERAHRQFDGS